MPQGAFTAAMFKNCLLLCDSSDSASCYRVTSTLNSCPLSSLQQVIRARRSNLTNSEQEIL